MPSAAPPVVLLVLAGLQAACPAYLSAQGLGPARHETIAVAPEEREAALRCDGSPCSEARVEARTHRASGTIYLAGLGIEFVGVAGLGAATAASFGTNWIPIVGYFVLGTVMVTDGITGVVQWARGAFDDQLEISLPQRAELDYRGRRITLGADDLVDPRDRARVLSRFSAQLALARRGVVELAARPAGSKLAVLELRHADMRDEDARYFADAVRTALVRARPGVDLITRENLLVLLAGTDPAACEGECEVETGRRIGADQVVSGEVLKLGETFKLSLKLHDTREGRLLNATSCSGASLEELDRALPSTVADLLR